MNNGTKAPRGWFKRKGPLAIEHTYRHVSFKRMVMPIFNRASYSRVQSLIERFTASEKIKLTVVLSSSTLWEEYGNASHYIKKDNPTIEFKCLDIGHNDSSLLGMCEASSRIIDQLAKLCAEEKYDGMIVIADRYETLPAALVGAYLQIPMFHIQGGEITGNIDEKVRHAVTKLSDYHFTCTRLSAKYVHRMGEERDRIITPGCPSIDLATFLGGRRFIYEKYFISMFHPETSVSPDEAFRQVDMVFEACRQYAYKYGHRCYWFYPNCDPGREKIIEYLNENIKKYAAVFIKAVNKPPRQFLKQLNGARLIIGNSSCGLREASFIGLPCINVGDRQSLRERAWNVLDVKYDINEIYNALVYQHEIRRYPRSLLYGIGHAHEAIYRQLLIWSDWSIKPPLTYPFLKDFKEAHFGENRFKSHKQRKGYGPRGPDRRRKVRMDLQGKPTSARPGDGQDPIGASGGANADRSTCASEGPNEPDNACASGLPEHEST